MHQHPKAAPVSSISMSDLFEAGKAGKTTSSVKALVLDVRTREEFAEGHVPGAKNIPFDEIPARVAELEGVDELYVYCRSGGRVGYACGVLSQMEFKKIHAVLSGGMPDWSANGFPVE